MKKELVRTDAKKSKHEEYDLQKEICQYLEMQYKSVLFLSDMAGSIRLTMPQAMRNKSIQKNGFKCPDLLILEPKKGFHGLFIELKKETPYKKDGTIKKSQNDHLESQQKSIQMLKLKGYFSDFRWDFDNCKRLIDWYLN